MWHKLRTPNLCQSIKLVNQVSDGFVHESGDNFIN